MSTVAPRAVAASTAERTAVFVLRRGAGIACGGGVVEGDGFFYQPTVLVDVAPTSQLMSQEIFGPVAPLIGFDDEAEVVELANDTDWGLVGYAFTRDLDRAFRLQESIEVGMLGSNTGLVSNPAAPFGGVKESGLGREGVAAVSTSSSRSVISRCRARWSPSSGSRPARVVRGRGDPPGAATPPAAGPVRPGTGPGHRARRTRR
ncbi:aldehyde dehydrogenase family protein [Calidifontibacter terrae]